VANTTPLTIPQINPPESQVESASQNNPSESQDESASQNNPPESKDESASQNNPPKSQDESASQNNLPESQNQDPSQINPPESQDKNAPRNKTNKTKQKIRPESKQKVKSEPKSYNLVSTTISQLDVENEEARAVEGVMNLASKHFDRAKPFLQGHAIWQETLWNYFEFYDKLAVPLHVQDPAEPAKDFTIAGSGTIEDGYTILSDTEDEAEVIAEPSSDREQQTQEEDIATKEQPNTDLDIVTQQYIASRISYKRKNIKNYKERIRIYGTNEPVPNHYFNLRTSDLVEQRYVVISVLDHEVLDGRTNYHCLCDIRVGTDTINQQIFWFPAESPLLTNYPQTALIKNYRAALKYTPLVSKETLDDDEKGTIVSHSNGAFVMSDLEPHNKIYNAFVMLLRHEPSEQAIQDNDASLLQVLQSANGFVTLSISDSSKDRDLSLIYQHLGVISDKAGTHRRFVAGQLSLLVEVSVELLREGGFKGGKAAREARNVSRSLLRDNEINLRRLAQHNELAIDQQLELDSKTAKAKGTSERRLWSSEVNQYALYRLLGPCALLDNTLSITMLEAGLTTDVFKKMVLTCCAMGLNAKWELEAASHIHGCRIGFEKIFEFAQCNGYTSLDKANFFLRAETIANQLMGNMEALKRDRSEH
jgi:hypothetical protein